MSRSRRISWLNYPHLVIAKANGQSRLFVDEDDYQSYLVILRQMARDRLLKVFAYCLLEHELRLVVLPSRLMLSRIIQRLHKKHTMRMNTKMKQKGHLFRDRFKSLIFSESDLIDVVRSVHLWPVREGLSRRTEHFPYSSHGYYLGVRNDSDFLSCSEVLNKFSGDLDTKRRAFSRFVETMALEADDFGVQEISPGIGGQSAFAHELIKKAHQEPRARSKSSIKTLAERASLLLNISLDQLLGASRRQDLVMGRRLLASAAVLGADRSITEVAQFLHRDKAQISRLVAQGMDLVSNNEAFSSMFDALKAKGARSQIKET